MKTQSTDRIQEQATTPTYLDQTHVLELLGGDVILVQSLLTAYLQASPEEIAALQQAIITDDRRDVAVRAHRLRGSLRYLGARDLEDMLLEIETATSQTQQQELVISYHLFHAAAHTLAQEIRHWQSRLRQTAS